MGFSEHNRSEKNPVQKKKNKPEANLLKLCVVLGIQTVVLFHQNQNPLQNKTQFSDLETNIEKRKNVKNNQNKNIEEKIRCRAIKCNLQPQQQQEDPESWEKKKKKK